MPRKNTTTKKPSTRKPKPKKKPAPKRKPASTPKPKGAKAGKPKTTSDLLDARARLERQEGTVARILARIETTEQSIGAARGRLSGHRIDLAKAKKNVAKTKKTLDAIEAVVPEPTRSEVQEYHCRKAIVADRRAKAAAKKKAENRAETIANTPKKVLAKVLADLKKASA